MFEGFPANAIPSAKNNYLVLEYFFSRPKYPNSNSNEFVLTT